MEALVRVTKHEWTSVYDMAWAMTMAKSVQGELALTMKYADYTDTKHSVACATIFVHSCGRQQSQTPYGSPLILHVS